MLGFLFEGRGENSREFDKIVGSNFGQRSWRVACCSWTEQHNLSLSANKKAQHKARLSRKQISDFICYLLGALVAAFAGAAR